MNNMDLELKKLKIKYQKLLIEDIKIDIRRKKILKMLDRAELWRVTKLRKEIEESYKIEEDEKDKEISRLLI